MSSYENTPDRIAPQGPPNAKKHRARVQTGLFVSSVVIASAAIGGWAWVGFVVFVGWVGFQELAALMETKQLSPSRLIVIPTGALILLFASLNVTSLILPTLTAGIMLAFFRLLFRQPRGSIGDIGATFVALFYAIFLPAHFILLRNLGGVGVLNPLEQPGFGYLMLTCGVLAFSDIGAYYAGKFFGKHLLYPAISPKKTKEGAIGGFISGLGFGLLMANSMGFPLEHAVTLSLILVTVGQLGDLVESLFKREAGVKDSGKLLEGHGGLLDRIDSYIFSGAVSYYYIYWIVRQEGWMQDVIRWLSLVTGSLPS